MHCCFSSKKIAVGFGFGFLYKKGLRTPYFIEPRMLLMWEAPLSYVLFRKKKDAVNYCQILADFSDGC